MSAERALRDKNDQVVTFSLVEVLTMFVFIAMALAIVLQREATSGFRPKDEIIAELRAQLRARDREVAALQKQVATLEKMLDAERRFIAKLLAKSTAPPKAGDVFTINRAQFAAYVNAEAVVAEQQKEIARHLARIAQLKGGGRGAEYPSCTVTSGFLLNIRALGSGGFAVRPAWAEGAAAGVQQVAGVPSLVAAGSVSKAQFNRWGQQINRWADAQIPPCRFRVKMSPEHGNLGLFLAQLQTAEQYFYVRRTR